MPRIAVPEGIITKIFILDDNALPMVADVLKEQWPGKRPWIIADGNTWEAAGKKVTELLKEAGFTPAEPYLLPAVPKPHPDWALAQKIAAAMPENTVPVAVGSGVINDLVKTASGINNVSYCCVPTAPSVDGYTSNGAALSVDGFKKTVPCPAPTAVVADKGVLLTAPQEMAAAGYGDLAAKVVAGADWIIADAVKQDPIRPEIWAIVQKDLQDWIKDHKDLKAVFMGLAATGYAMQQHHDSRPASGSEHMFSHVWEMEGLTCSGEEVSHGFKVSVGTVITLKLQQFFMQTTLEEAKRLAAAPATLEERRKETAELFKKGCYGEAPEKCALSKFLEPEAALARREEIYAVWNDLQKKVGEQLGDQEAFVEKIKASGCPVDFSEIGLSREQFLHGIRTAQLIRNRYTILDLLYDTGLFDTAIATIYPQEEA